MGGISQVSLLVSAYNAVKTEVVAAYEKAVTPAESHSESKPRVRAVAFGSVSTSRVSIPEPENIFTSILIGGLSGVFSFMPTKCGGNSEGNINPSANTDLTGMDVHTFDANPDIDVFPSVPEVGLDTAEDISSTEDNFTPIDTPIKTDVVDPHDKDGDKFIDIAYAKDGLCVIYDPKKNQTGQPLCDCNDYDTFTNPAAKEIPCDGIDQDCDGKDLEDKDKDGYGGCPDSFPYDCDDTNPLINPGAVELQCNDIDENCDGMVNDKCVPSECEEGETKKTGVNLGICIEKVEVCKDGKFNVFQEGIAPKAEVCNGKDDNCDGLTDNGLFQTSYTGPNGTEGVGPYPIVRTIMN